MLSRINPETLHAVVNIALYGVLVVVAIVILRGVFKIAWKVIRLILILLGALIIAGYLLGFLKISII
jgi:hypothetical protein